MNVYVLFILIKRDLNNKNTKCYLVFTINALHTFFSYASTSMKVDVN
jgi:hypothetical protein